MKKICYIAISADGFISDINGDVDFLEKYNSDEVKENIDSFARTIDSILMGEKTYNQIIKWLDNDWSKFEFCNKNVYVLTKEKNTGLPKFISGNPKQTLKIIENDKNKNLWIFGGANCIKQFVENDLIDEYIISVVDEILGEGIKFYTINELKNMGLKEYKVEKIDKINAHHFVKKVSK